MRNPLYIRLPGGALIVLAAALCGALALGPVPALAKVKVAASITDLGSIAASVGGDQVEVVSIARSNADPHRVEVLPSYMVRVSKAQVYLKVGLGLDQWADQIIDGSRNDKIVIVDCGQEVAVLDKPTGKVDASQGDVHPNGNPHYWLDPHNGAIVAREIAEGLSKVDPAHAVDFAARAAAFGKEVEASATRGAELLKSLPVRTILTYHASWVYLAHAFGLEIAGTVEPVPGIPPTGRHLQELVDVVKGRNIQVLLQEPYFSQEAGGFLAREAGVRPVTASASCDAAEAGSYLAHIERVLQMIAGSGASGGGASSSGR
jgi:zinc/manganese transport system substrate-binding protein